MPSHPSRSSQGADLERHHQRRRGGADHGDDHAHGLAQSSNGRVRADEGLVILGSLTTAVMAAGGWDVCDMGKLSRSSPHRKR
jgi:hypothetical protein